MKKIYKNRLPKGMEVASTNVRVEDGNVFVYVELKKEFSPKDGDFLISSLGNIFIYNDIPSEKDYRISCYCGVYDGKGQEIETKICKDWTEKDGCRFATDQEKANFLSRLKKECGKKWNAEKKCLEDILNPKDGDFLVTKNGCIFIYNTNYKTSYLCGFYAGIDADNKIVISDGISGFSGVGRFADKQEKINFLARLEKECHKRWNPETKKLETIRWRAMVNKGYYYIGTERKICVNAVIETNDWVDTVRYKSCNYFRTAKSAQKVADQIREIFKNSKAE